MLIVILLVLKRSSHMSIVYLDAAGGLYFFLEGTSSVRHTLCKDLQEIVSVQNSGWVEKLFTLDKILELLLHKYLVII